MSESLHKLAGKVNALSLRERGLLLLAVLVVIYTMWDNLLMSPLEKRRQEGQQALAELTAHITELGARTQAALASQPEDPNLAQREKIKILQARLQEIKAPIEKLTASLVSPGRMTQALEGLLQQQTGLKLIRVENGPAHRITQKTTPEAQATKGPSKTGIFRHDLTLEFRGDYLSILAYLKAAEQLPWRLFWDTVDIRVEKYPQTRVIIQVHTLSLQEGWIGA